MRRKLRDKIRIVLKVIYRKLFRINDTPQKIAVGLALGVFTGILPGTGPLAALFLAAIFRVNRASAFLGSILTNTWLSILTFIMATKIGASIMGISWKTVQENWTQIVEGFHWANLFKNSVFKIILPVILGYAVISVCLGLSSYLVAILILKLRRKKGLSVKKPSVFQSNVIIKKDK